MNTSRRLMLILSIGAALLLPVLGVIAGFPIGRAWNSGALERWKRLPDPPADPVEIAAGTLGEVYIDAADGRTYVCEDEGSACWVERAVPENLPVENEDCDQWTLRYSVRPAPGTVVDSLQAQWCHFEAGEEVNYALLDDGSVWRWHHFDANYLNMARVLMPMGGGCAAGVLVGVALVIFAWVRGRRGKAEREKS